LLVILSSLPSGIVERDLPLSASDVVHSWMVLRLMRRCTIAPQHPSNLAEPEAAPE
jgi:hypothetical protein